MTISITKPTVGGSENTWGGTVNTALDDVVDVLNGNTASTPDLTEGSWKVGGTAVSASAAELNHTDGVTSNIQTQLNSKQPTITGAATTIDDADLTVSRALVSNSSGKVAVSAATDTEVGYLSGVTSAIQTQIDGKAANTTLAESDWTTGTSTTEAIVSPAKLKAAIAAQPSVTIVRGSTSTATTSLTHVANHGQSSRPDFVWAEVIITTAQHGYAIGDCIKVGNVYERDEDDVHTTLWGNATQMGLSTNVANTYMYVANRSSGTPAALLTGQSIRIVGVWYD